jgi:hypothetical protein
VGAEATNALYRARKSTERSFERRKEEGGEGSCDIDPADDDTFL